MKKRKGRKRAVGTRAPMELPSGPNQRWSMDFVSDSFTDGRRFRIFAVVDDFSRECLALVPDTSISGARVVRELDRLLMYRGKPERCVSDNGTEFTSMAILKWSQEQGVDWHYIQRPCRAWLRHDANRSRMHSRKLLTGDCATSASTRRCSRP